MGKIINTFNERERKKTGRLNILSNLQTDKERRREKERGRRKEDSRSKRKERGVLTCP